MEQFDVVIVGAGLAGIGAAVRLQTMCRSKSYAILEARDAIGGTWDLFRYPGVRSDSDMYTLAYPFRPWSERQAIVEGSSILRYIRETAAEHAIEPHIRYRHQVESASWSSATNRWTLEVAVPGSRNTVRFTAGFVYLCSGYYRYDDGYTPELPGMDRFAGVMVHPQHWPDGLDCRGKRIVIIGSGATAVTLAPALAADAGHVTVLQRSPSYILAVPAVEPLADPLYRALPRPVAFGILRWKNILLTTALYQLCRRRPEMAKRLLRGGVVRQLPAGYDVDPDFSPRYNPWDQRLCLAADGDLFAAIGSGRVSMVTDRIDTLTSGGIRLESGRELAADVVVSATGLNLLACGGIRLEVDGSVVEPGHTLIYRGFMLSGIPNLAMCLGYTNASWTLRADLTSRSVCRLLNRMDRAGVDKAVPRLDPGAGEPRPLLDLSSGYVARAADRMPKQGSKSPWRLRQNYVLDLLTATFGDVGARLAFSGRPGTPADVGAEHLLDAEAAPESTVGTSGWF